MTDAPPPKQGSGKLLASMVASAVVIHGAAYARSHFNFDVDQESMLDVEAALIGFWVWLTPANVVASIKSVIADWKDILKAWRQP
jgi:hypothetical protein